MSFHEGPNTTNSEKSKLILKVAENVNFKTEQKQFDCSKTITLIICIQNIKHW